MCGTSILKLIVSTTSPLEFTSTRICIIVPFHALNGTNQFTNGFAVSFTCIFSTDDPEAFQPVDESDLE